MSPSPLGWPTARWGISWVDTASAPAQPWISSTDMPLDSFSTRSVMSVMAVLSAGITLSVSR